MKLLAFGIVFLGLFGNAIAAAELYVGTGMRVITPDPLLPISGGLGPTSRRKINEVS